MNPPIPVRDGQSPSQSTAEQQVKGVIPLWRAAEVYGLAPTPAHCKPSGRGTALAVGAIR